MPDIDLVTVYNIPLAEVGEDWHASTGDVSITEDDLRAAIAALDDPAVRSPRLKLGHTDPRFTPDGDKGIFDGTPALGKFVNVRLDESGQTIVGDAAGVPRWLSEIMPTAYASRSIEGYWGVTTSTGKKHDFVLTAVSLLGVVPPAIETLDDLPVFYSTEGPNGVQMVEGKKVVASKEMKMPKSIKASVSYEAVRRSFYEDFAVDERYWWWIHATFVDPPSVIAEDDSGGCWYVPFETSGDTVEWGDPAEVKVQYADKDSGKVLARSQAEDAEPVKVFATASESRPSDRRVIIFTKTPTTTRLKGGVSFASLN